MDLLTKQQLDRAGRLLVDAARIQTHDEGAEKQVGFLDMSAREVQRYSILRGIQALRETLMKSAMPFLPHLEQAERWPRFTGLEAECHNKLAERLGRLPHPGWFYVPAEILYRDLTAAVAGSGGYVVGTTTGGSFIEALRNRAAIFRLGGVMMPGQRESLAIPKQTTNATIVWQSTEATQATETSSLNFAQAAGAPKTAIAYLELSNQLLKQSNPAAEAIVTLAPRC